MINAQLIIYKNRGSGSNGTFKAARTFFTQAGPGRSDRCWEPTNPATTGSKPEESAGMIVRRWWPTNPNGERNWWWLAAAQRRNNMAAIRAAQLAQDKGSLPTLLLQTVIVPCPFDRGPSESNFRFVLLYGRQRARKRRFLGFARTTSQSRRSSSEQILGEFGEIMLRCIAEAVKILDGDGLVFG